MDWNVYRASGATSKTIKAQIRADSSGLPGDVLAESTTVLNVSDLGTVQNVFVRFDFAGFSREAGTMYWDCLAVSTNDTVAVMVRGGSSGTGNAYISNGSSPWFSVSTRKANLKTYSQ